MVKAKPSKGMAFVAVFFGLIGFLIALLTKKDDKYVMYYASQSLALTVAGVACNVVMIIPILGWIAGAIGGIIVTVLWFMAWIRALSGTTKPLPMLQWLADKFKF